ncbi:peroxidase-like protein [Elysia marginata]|uniref:Peroxidase-like protein n=1 Tax=Elysia marginata TaxID=1093978 RepID=A0AAV4F2G3_9GAST|nr:peroxidase-like protein [Elysia marginata]
MDGLTESICRDEAMAMDRQFSHSVTRHLFQEEERRGFDLVALNLQICPGTPCTDLAQLFPDDATAQAVYEYDSDDSGRNDDDGGSDTDEDGSNGTDDDGGNLTNDDDGGDDSGPPLGSISERGLLQVQGLRAAKVCGPPRPTYDQSLDTTHTHGSLSGYSRCRLTASQFRRDIDDVDLFTGGVAEKPVDDGLVGPTFACLLGTQFNLLRNGDRFFYLNPDRPESFTRGIKIRNKYENKIMMMTMI